MPSTDLLRAAKELAHLATHPSAKPGDRGMRNAAKSVLANVAGAKPAEVRGALRALAAGAKDARGPHADVLHLTIGALVEEAGAPAEVAWPVLAERLPAALALATTFGVAVVRAAKTQVVQDALASKGAEIAAALPEEARAWQELPARCLAAAACLSRSRELRDAARASGLRAEAETLSLGVPEVAQLVQLLDALEEERVTVLHPASKRGFALLARDITMLAELLVLAAAALCGDPKKGKLAGERPSAAAVKALANQDPRSRGKAVRAPATFELLPWDALDAKGNLDARAHAHDHGLDLSASPASVPRVDGQLVVLLRDPDHLHAIEIEPPPGDLSPAVEVERELDAQEVEALVARLAAVRAKPAKGKRAPEAKAAPKAKAKAKAAPRAKAKAAPKAKAKAAPKKPAKVAAKPGKARKPSSSKKR